MVEPSLTIGKFKVLSPLGQGAASAILKIRRDADLKTYALKVIALQSADDSKYLDQAATEFEVGRALDHPGIVKVYALEKTRKLFRVTGARLLVEFVDGLPLSRCPHLPMLRLVKIFFKTAEALAHMHKRGFFHADLKPDNIMVTPEGESKLIDLGLAWKRGEKKHRVQGTLEFLAPEQASEKIVNERTDVFNFGATMYRTLTGNPVPSQLRDPGIGRMGPVDDLVQPIVQYRPDCPADLDQLVRRCIRYNREDRPESMREVRNQLREIGMRLKRSQA